MIRSIRHRGLKRLFERGDRSQVSASHIGKVELILADLDAAGTLGHMRQPGYRLHKLRGSLAGHHAVDVSGNWRITFRYDDGDVFDVDLIDYH